MIWRDAAGPWWLYLANYGLPLGSGTQILRLGCSHTGARLR